MNKHTSEVVRYVVNGITATIAHYSAFTFNLIILKIPSAGIANLAAAIIGITVSFFGNRYYVFRRADEHLVKQFMKFSGLYGVIALIHGLVLLIWADWLGYDYRIGFLIATTFQVTLSYSGNKLLVFKT